MKQRSIAVARALLENVRISLTRDSRKEPLVPPGPSARCVHRVRRASRHTGTPWRCAAVRPFITTTSGLPEESVCPVRVVATAGLNVPEKCAVPAVYVLANFR